MGASSASATLPCEGTSGTNSALSKAHLLERITIEPGKCGGRPCIRGQRLRVKDVLELLSAGASYEEILADYAFLKREELQAVVVFQSGSGLLSPHEIPHYSPV